MADISRNTLFKWLKNGVLGDPVCRDWRGWRLYSEEQIRRLKSITGSGRDLAEK
jgi:DNA-binding transcriptional MerR regulator